MGFLSREELPTVYRRIRREAAGRTTSILILAAPTVDALCALEILTNLLRNDLLSYKVVPVSGYDDILGANENFIQGREEIRSVILLDCGGTVDLAELMSLTSTMSVYLFDSHRPYSLYNVFNNSQLYIMDDGFIEDNHDCLRQAYEATTFDDQMEDYDEDYDDEDNSMDFSEDRIPITGGLVSAGEDHPHRTVGHQIDFRDERNSKEEKRIGKRASIASYRAQCRDRLHEYFREGSWYGTCVARLLFDIADGLGRGCNDYLWCSILGTTYHHIMELSTASAYANEVAWLRERCLQLNSSNKDNTAENGHIRFEPEFRFMLARHWTLFNGMLHSRFMATRLAVWRDRGKRMLETFIVKMGIPLAQCKLDFSSMEVEIKDSLPFRIARHAAEFGLEDIQFPSFLRNFGFVMKLSASDAVYALMALIETPSDGGGKTRDSWVSSFFSALEALNPSHVTKFKLGIKMAMRQQQTILNEASNILSHKLIRYGRRFRHVVLRNSTDLPWLTTHPQTLTKLALFLAEATMTAPNGRTPLLLAAYQPTHDTYLVVSTNTPNAKDSIAPHKRATQALRARVKHDGFESSLIEIKAADLKPFLQELQTIPI